MNRSMTLRVAAVASSIVLAGGYVMYQGGFGPFARAKGTQGDPGRAAQSTTSKQPIVLPGSKSARIAPAMTSETVILPEGWKDGDQKALFPGSKAPSSLFTLPVQRAGESPPTTTPATQPYEPRFKVYPATKQTLIVPTLPIYGPDEPEPEFIVKP